MADDDDNGHLTLGGWASGDRGESGEEGAADTGAADPNVPGKEDEKPAPKAKLVKMPEGYTPDLSTPAGVQAAEQDYVQQMITARKKAQYDAQQNLKAQEWANKQMAALSSIPKPQMPTFAETYPQTTPPPNMQQMQRDKMHSLLGYFAIAVPLALAFGRRGPAGWGAMKGMAEGINAINEGYQDRAKAAAAIWKQQNDLALKQGEERMAYYKDTMEARGTDIKEKMDLIKYGADYWKDKQTADLAEAGDLDKVLTHLEHLGTLLNNAQKNRPKAEESFFKYIGADKEFKDYILWLAQKMPELRHDLLKGDEEAYWKAYDKATSAHPQTEYLHELNEQKKLTSEARSEGTAEGKKADKKPDKTHDNPLGLDLPKDDTESEGGGGAPW